MISKLESLINNQNLSDVKFLVGNENRLIYGHKLILAMNSEVFKNMFYDGLTETEAPIKLPDIKPSSFIAMMNYMYTRNFNFQPNILADVYLTCDKFLIEEFNSKIFDYISSIIDTENSCLIYEQLVKIDKINLFKNVIFFICTRAKEIFKNDTFNEINESTLISILNLDYLLINEIDILKSCVKWIKKQSELLIKNNSESNDKNILKSTLNNKINLEPTLNDKINLFKKIKNNILFSELSNENLRDFEQIDNLLSIEEIGYLNLYMLNKNRSLPIECKTNRKILSSDNRIDYIENAYRKINYFLVDFYVYNEIIIKSIDLRNDLNNLNLTIYENGINLNLNFDYTIIDGYLNIKFPNFTFKQGKYLFDFKFNSFEMPYFSGLAINRFENSDNIAVEFITDRIYSILLIHKIYFDY